MTRQTITTRISKRAKIKLPRLEVSRRALKALRSPKRPNEHKLKSIKRSKNITSDQNTSRT